MFLWPRRCRFISLGLRRGSMPRALVPVGDGVCPACGGPPVSSMIVGWSGAQSARFCACSLCGTLWNYPRVKCTLCGATKGIAYQEIAGGPATVKAETCESCRGYVKILHQQKDRRSIRSLTTSRRSRSTCCCATRAIGAAPSTRS